MQRSSRVDYDAIAPLYDSQPHREKSPDPALAAFLAERSALGTALLLDIACGTGNQLVANRAIASSARMVGFDGSLGMLRQARAKSLDRLGPRRQLGIAVRFRHVRFPEALTRDLADFWPPEAIAAEMTAAGFADVVVHRDHRRHERNLATFLEGLRRRDRNSQLLTLSDTAYEAGLRRLESELADPSAPRSRADHLCFVTVRGDKPLH